MPLPLAPPLSPQLARSRTSLPEGEGWAYEPKFDGFRALVFVDGDEVVIKSRNGKPLDRYFPEVVASVPAGCYVLDGEIVAETFDTLGQRIHPAKSRIERLSVETPARLIAFDLLALGDDVPLERPQRQRRAPPPRAAAPPPPPPPPPAARPPRRAPPRAGGGSTSRPWCGAPPTPRT